MGNLADVSGACRAGLSCHGGRDAVGPHHALPDAGEGGTRDLGWNSTQLLPNPRHHHIQRIVASRTADQGGRQVLVCQVQLYFGGGWRKIVEASDQGPRRSLRPLRVKVGCGDRNVSVPEARPGCGS